MMQDANEEESNVIDYIKKKYTNSRYYHSMLKKLIKEVEKSESIQNQTASLFTDTSINMIRTTDQSQMSKTQSIFSSANQSQRRMSNQLNTV